jgi:hypothetical protein
MVKWHIYGLYYKIALKIGKITIILILLWINVSRMTSEKIFFPNFEKNIKKNTKLWPKSHIYGLCYKMAHMLLYIISCRI